MDQGQYGSRPAHGHVVGGRVPRRRIRGRKVHNDDRLILETLEFVDPREADRVAGNVSHGVLVQTPDRELGSS